LSVVQELVSVCWTEMVHAPVFPEVEEDEEVEVLEDELEEEEEAEFPHQEGWLSPQHTAT